MDTGHSARGKPVRVAAVREDMLLETDSVRGPNLCEEMEMAQIHNLVRVFDLLGTLPNTAEVTAFRSQVVSVLLKQDERTPEDRAYLVLEMYLKFKNFELGLVIFEALFAAYHASLGTIVAALEKRARDGLSPADSAMFYPVLITSLMAASNWCEKASEASNLDFAQALPRILGRLLGRFALVEAKIPSFDSTFMGKYGTALTGYLSKVPQGSGLVFARATSLMGELDDWTKACSINEGAYRFLQELIQRVSMLFAQKTQIEMLSAQLQRAHIVEVRKA